MPQEQPQLGARGGVEEIPFDVADWGERVVPALYASDAERAAFAAMPPDPAFDALVVRQQELERERLGL